MTASVPAATSFTYTGDAATTGFSFPLKFLENADVEVYVDGVLKTITTHYTITGAGGPSGGTVTFVSAPAAATAIELRRSTLPKQTVDLSDSGRTPGDTLEGQIDRLAMASQDQSERIKVLDVDLEWVGPWATATAYALNDLVSEAGSSYICVEAHTSGTFATDLAAMKWEIVAQKGDTGGIGASIRNRYAGYTPVYNLDDAMDEGAGTDLAVQNIVDIGDITLPSGAEKQYAWLRARGTFTNGDAFETNGARLIGYNLYSENADLYGVIGTVYLLSGDKEVKSIYGRAVNESTDGGVVVGLVGGVTLQSGSVTDHAWVMQLTHDGPALAAAGNNRVISIGTNETTKLANYGIYFDEALGFDIAVMRAWQTNAGGGDFIQWLDSGDNTLFKVGNNGDVYMGALSAAQRSFRFFNTSREFSIQAVNTGDRVRMQAGSVGDLWSFTAATLAAIGDTSMSVRARNTAGSALLAVTLGAVDSGGAGFRAMCVPN